MKRLFTVLALFAASAFGDPEEEFKSQESLPCTNSKMVVEETPEVTYFRVIADSGETLLDINSNTTSMIPFDSFLTIEFMHPETGHWAFANNTIHYITNNQTTAGDIKRLDGKTGLAIFRPIDVHDKNKPSLIKSDFKCVRIHDFSLVIDPAFDIKEYDGYNMTALLWSSLFGLSNVARNLILRGADVNQGFGKYGIPVIAAILSNQTELVEFMIQRGANVLIHENRWFSTLHIAAFAGNTHIARILIDHGVSVNEDDNMIRVTPLHFAAMTGQCDTLQLLISKGANVNSLFLGSLTAFHAAIAFGHLECGHKLIAAGADVNAKDADGTTALALAVIKQKDETRLVEIIDRYLKEFTPDVNIRNNKGESALTIVTKKKFTRVAELLKSKGAV